MGGVDQPKTGGRAKGTPNRAKLVQDETPAAAPPPAPAPADTSGSRTGGRVRAREASESPRPLATRSDSGKLTVQQVAIDTLIEHAGNARTHSVAQITKLANSIREFGWTSPVLTDGKLGILAGHGRVLAAKQLGMKTVPVIALSLTAKQRRAYVIADNKLALDAGWDLDALAAALGELREQKFDVALTGFEDLEVDGLLGLGVDDEPAEPRVSVKTTAEAVCPGCGHKFRV